MIRFAGCPGPPRGVGLLRRRSPSALIGLRDRPRLARRRHGPKWPYPGALFLALIVVALVPWLSVGFL